MLHLPDESNSVLQYVTPVGNFDVSPGLLSAVVASSGWCSVGVKAMIAWASQFVPINGMHATAAFPLPGYCAAGANQFGCSLVH